MQDVPASTQRAARQLFLEANVLINDSLFGKAVAKYKQALDLWDHPAFHYNLAIAQINLDQPVIAFGNFQRALRYGNGPLGPGKYKEGRNYLTLLQNQLARLEVICRTPGGKVTIDGELLLQCPGSRQIMLKAGGHQLVASKPDRLPRVEQLVLAAGQEIQHVVEFEQYKRVRRWPTWIPWSVLGFGAVTIAGAGMVNWRASVRLSEAYAEFAEKCRTECDESTQDELLGRLDRTETRQQVSFIVVGVGAVSVLTGALLLYLNRERLVRLQEDSAEAVTVRPALSLGGGQVSVIWHF